MTTVDFHAETDSSPGGVEAFRPRAVVGATDFPDGHARPETQGATAVGEHNPPAPASECTAPKDATPVLAPLGGDATPYLALLADVLDDLERTRIANENRLRQLTRSEADKDGEQRGFGLSPDMPQVAALADLVAALGKLEHSATLELQRAVRKHPLGPWVKATIGVGEKQGARLIAALGDPYWNTLYNRPRLVSELWAYCGLHVLPAAQTRTDSHWADGDGGKQGNPGQKSNDTHVDAAGVAPTRARGQKANWSATAKMRAFLVAESCIKQAQSPYRRVYETGRQKYDGAVHQVTCKRCGPAGRPALAGTPLSAGHQHARAMRLVMKEILRDLWLESKRLHEEAG